DLSSGRNGEGSGNQRQGSARWFAGSVRNLEPRAFQQSPRFRRHHGARSVQADGIIMSLVRLLTAGKSLIGIQEETSRYRMRAKNLLPKFGSDKNPFAAPAPAATSSPNLFPAPEPVVDPAPSAPVEAVVNIPVAPAP